MNGALFLICTIGIGLVLWWCKQNDDVTREGTTSGLLAMPVEAPPAEGVAGQTSRRGRPGRRPQN